MTFQCDNETREFLEMMALPKIKRYISTKIKTKEFINYWKKAKEKTSPSIPGLYFCHYRRRAESKLVSKLHTLFLDTTIKTGTVIERWTKVLSVMMKKNKGKY